MTEPVQNTRLYLRHPNIARLLAALKELSRSRFTWFVVLPLVIAYFIVQGVWDHKARIRQANLDQVDADLLMLVEAINHYKEQKGLYPATLEALQEEGLTATVPIDPFSRKKEPYRYLNLNEGRYVVVYSVGADGRDDLSDQDIIRQIHTMNPDAPGQGLMENLQIELTKGDPQNGMSYFMRALLAKDFEYDHVYQKADLARRYGWQTTLEYISMIKKEQAADAMEQAAIPGPVVVYDPIADTTTELPGQTVTDSTAVDPIPIDFRADAWYDIVEGNEDLLELFARNETAFDLLLEGARTPYDKIGELGSGYLYGSIVPNYLPAQMLAKLTLARCRYLESQGRVLDALESGYAVVRLGQAVGHNPYLISKLIDIAVEGMAYRCLQDCILDADLTPEELRMAIQRLEALEESSPAMADSLRGEQKIFTDQVKAVSIFKRETLFDFDGPIFGDPNFLHYLSTAWIMVRRGKIIRNNAELWNRFIAETQKPYPEMDKVDREEFTKGTDILNRISFPHFINAHVRDLVCRTDSTATKILVGLRHYRAVHGEYPDSLDQIADLYATPPIDPFSTKPFVYVREGDGFMLYSLGPELGDEKAAIEYDPTNGTVSVGDIVFN